MRWSVLVIICLSLLAIGLEQTPVSGQMGYRVARSCGGCGLFGCRPRLFPRRYRALDDCCGCTGPITSPSCCAPAQIRRVPVRPRRMVTWEMVPCTRYRTVAHCEQVPVTTVRRVVTYVPQTHYRNVVRYHKVPEQVMVPRRRVIRVYPSCPTPGITPCGPGTLPLGSTPTYAPGPISGPTYLPPGTITPSPSITPSPYTSPYSVTPNSNPPTLTVPNTPQLNNRVPAPADPPTSDDQSMFIPWNPLTQASPYYHLEETDQTASGYRTLPRQPATANQQDYFESFNR